MGSVGGVAIVGNCWITLQSGWERERERDREKERFICTYFLLSERNKNEHDNENTNKSPQKSIVYVHMLRVKE